MDLENDHQWLTSQKEKQPVIMYFLTTHVKQPCQRNETCRDQTSRYNYQIKENRTEEQVRSDH